MQLPDGAAQPAHPRIDNTLVKALARAFRWKRMLETGEFATIAELAQRERITLSYMTRVLRLWVPTCRHLPVRSTASHIKRPSRILWQQGFST